MHQSLNHKAVLKRTVDRFEWTGAYWVEGESGLALRAGEFVGV